jgi:site-specific DNA recombinase
VGYGPASRVPGMGPGFEGPEVETALAAASATSPLAGIAGRLDAAEVWEGLDLGRRRALLRALADVTLLPARRGRGFDPGSVVNVWRR